MSSPSRTGTSVTIREECLLALNSGRTPLSEECAEIIESSARSGLLIRKRSGHSSRLWSAREGGRGPRARCHDGLDEEEGVLGEARLDHSSSSEARMRDVSPNMAMAAVTTSGLTMTGNSNDTTSASSYGNKVCPPGVVYDILIGSKTPEERERVSLLLARTITRGVSAGGMHVTAECAAGEGGAGNCGDDASSSVCYNNNKRTRGVSVTSAGEDEAGGGTSPTSGGRKRVTR